MLTASSNRYFGLSLPSGSFKECGSIGKVTVLNSNPPSGAEFSSIVYSNATLIVPDNCVSLYQISDGWKEFANITDESSTGFETINNINKNGYILKTPYGIIYRGDNPEHLVIYDMNGHLYYSVTIQPKQSITLPKGIYICVVNNRTVKIKI